MRPRGGAWCRGPGTTRGTGGRGRGPGPCTSGSGSASWPTRSGPATSTTCSPGSSGPRPASRSSGCSPFFVWRSSPAATLTRTRACPGRYPGASGSSCARLPCCCIFVRVSSASCKVVTPRSDSNCDATSRNQKQNQDRGGGRHRTSEHFARRSMRDAPADDRGNLLSFLRRCCHSSATRTYMQLNCVASYELMQEREFLCYLLCPDLAAAVVYYLPTYQSKMFTSLLPPPPSPPPPPPPMRSGLPVDSIDCPHRVPTEMQWLFCMASMHL